MKAEVGALHEAMAGLHGEMGAVQRELDGAKAGQDKLATGDERGYSVHLPFVIIASYLRIPRRTTKKDSRRRRRS